MPIRKRRIRRRPRYGPYKGGLQLVRNPAMRVRAPMFKYATAGTVYSFKRTFQFANFHMDHTTGLATSVGYSFKLNDLPNYTEFTALFDQYKITGIKIRLIPEQNQQALGVGVFNIPPIYTVIDYDDDTALTAITDAMQYQNCKIHTTISGSQIVRFFRPHIAVAAYSGTFTSYMNKSMQWIDSASPDTRHYGFKIIVAAITTLDTTFSVVATYYLKMRNVR